MTLPERNEWEKLPFLQNGQTDNLPVQWRVRFLPGSLFYIRFFQLLQVNAVRFSGL